MSSQHPSNSAMERVLRRAAEPEIVALEARPRDAQLNANVAALDALVADEILFTGTR